MKFNFFRSKEEKCTKAQPCSSGVCTWNQHITFFDIDNIDKTSLWVKLINLEDNQEILGDIKFNKLNLNNKPEWYNLNDTTNGSLKIERTLTYINSISRIIIQSCSSAYHRHVRNN